MPAKTRYLKKRVLDHVLGKGAYTAPTTVYLALFTAVPDETGALAGEVAGGGYARQAITATMQAADATSGASLNANPISYPAPTADWGTIVGFGVMDALSAGNMLYFGAIDTPRLITAGGAAFVVPAAALVLQET